MKKILLSLALLTIHLNYGILTMAAASSEGYSLYEDVEESNYDIDLMYWEVLPE